MILNLGCGDDGYGDVRLDAFRTPAANVLGDAMQLPFSSETFDEVYERNILEHLPNPAEHLSEVKRVLKNNGTLTLITDNAACLKYYTLGTHTGGYRKQHGRDVHYALFTREHIRNLVRFAGLSLTKLDLIDTDYPTKYFDRLTRMLVPSISYPRIRVSAVKRS